MRRRVALPSLAALLLSTAPASLAVAGEAAPDAPNYSSPGVYLGASGMYIVEYMDDEVQDDADDVFPRGGKVRLDDAGGFNIRAGLRAHEYVAVEFQFDWTSEFEGQVNNIPSATADTSTDAQYEAFTFTTNVRAYPLTGRIQPYVLVGAGVMAGRIEFDSIDLGGTIGVVPGFTANDTSFTTRWGFGVDFYITEQVAATAGFEYLLPFGPLRSAEQMLFGGGFTYTLRFSGAE